MDPNLFVAVVPIGGAIALTGYQGLVWVLHQKARIDQHDKQFENLEKRADERHAETKEWLERIEAKL
jgi:hypothetical protein